MDILILSGIALFGSAATLSVLFEVVERYDSSNLFRLLTNQQGDRRAMWLLSITVSLFAHDTALKAMAYLLERQLKEECPDEIASHKRD